jgi:prefoldin subunit 5
VAPADEVEALRAEADYLRRSIDAVNARIAELEKNRADE